MPICFSSPGFAVAASPGSGDTGCARAGAGAASTMAVIPIAPIALLNVTVFLSCRPDSGGVCLQADLPSGQPGLQAGISTPLPSAGLKAGSTCVRFGRSGRSRRRRRPDCGRRHSDRSSTRRLAHRGSVRARPRIENRGGPNRQPALHDQLLRLGDRYVRDARGLIDPPVTLEGLRLRHPDLREGLGLVGLQVRPRRKQLGALRRGRHMGTSAGRAATAAGRSRPPGG